MSRRPETVAEVRSYIRVCWLLFIISVLAVGYAVYSYVHQRDFVTRATRVQGKVVGNLHTISKHTDHYRAIFTFTDRSGKSWRVHDRDSHYELEPIPLDRPCTVLYDPADPGGAELENAATYTFFDLLGIAFVPGFTGVIFMTISVWALRKHYATLRRLRAAGGDDSPPRDPAILAGP